MIGLGSDKNCQNLYMNFLPSAKPNQSKVWPRFLHLYNHCDVRSVCEMWKRLRVFRRVGLIFQIVVLVKAVNVLVCSAWQCFFFNSRDSNVLRLVSLSNLCAICPFYFFSAKLLLYCYIVVFFHIDANFFYSKLDDVLVRSPVIFSTWAAALYKCIYQARGSEVELRGLIGCNLLSCPTGIQCDD